MYDVIVIGAGTAGLTAGIYAARANKKVLIFEKQTFGGQILNTMKIENYPGIKKTTGPDFSMSLFEQATSFGVEIRMESVSKIEKENKKFIITVADNNKYETKTVIIATGLKNKTLGIENEKKFKGKGISYCATCDANFFKDKVTAVIGNEKEAIDDAILLSEHCKKVYLINRNNIFQAEKELVEVASKNKKIEVITDSNITSINGDNTIENIEIISNITKEKKTLIIDGLFITIGRGPDTFMFSNLVNTDEKGYIIADESCKTNVDGIFVAGDCRTKKLRQLVTAASDGAVAAVSINQYIINNS